MKMVIVKMVKMMNFYVWSVKMNETVSDESREV